MRAHRVTQRALPAAIFMGTAQYLQRQYAGSMAQLRGTVTHWHPYQRHGSITTEDGTVYVIASTRAFETVLPTLMSSLEGATVTFDSDINPAADRVITRSRLTPITAMSYTEKAPIDFLNPLAAVRTSNEKQNGNAVGTKTELFAKNITVDLSCLPDKQLARITRHLAGEEAIAPTANNKDMRSSRIFDDDTKEYLQLVRQLGSPEAAQTAVDKRREASAKLAVHREVVATDVEGVVFAWSPLHRSGVVLEGLTGVPPDAVVGENSATSVCVIRNVFSFRSALPTSQDLLRRAIRFTKVTYSSHPNHFFAEDIVVQGALGYEAGIASLEAAREAKQKEHRKRQGPLGRWYEDATANEEAAPSPPTEPQYGVVTRWSGGQGTVESGAGRVYYIQSAADFTQLVDPSAHVVRGAVVLFRADPHRPRFAREIEVLSTARTSASHWKRTPSHRAEEAAADQVAPSLDASADLPWLEGILVTWSPHEGQGIISGVDGDRYVLRDAETHVLQYAARKDRLGKGRRVKFTAQGSTGRLASHVVPLDTEADEAEVREGELGATVEPQADPHPTRDEAIASPMSTSYWLGRMERVGYDVTEVKQLQGRAITPEDGPDDAKPFDSEEIMKSDPWWNDPRKNKKLPNSDMRYGQLSMVGPTSMLNIALNSQDPRRLNKMVNKYQSKLTEKQKEVAWDKAKEMAPKYEALVKKARDRNDEPKFYFF